MSYKMHLNESTRLYIFLLLIFSLFFSSYIGENSSGGAKLDSIITRQFIDGFLVSFDYGINYFIKTNQVLSPFFFFLMSFLEKILGQFFLKYLYVFVSSLIPLIFYISLKKKFRGVNKNNLFLISIIIFLSPYFRSSSSWMTTDNLATLFFILSISKYLSLDRKKNFKNLILCSLYLIAASYIRQYYAIFFILYLFLYYKFLKKSEFLLLLIVIFIFFVPLLIYYYYYFSINSGSNIDVNFINLFSANLLYTSLVFSSLYFFYLLPFYLIKNGIKEISNYIKINTVIYFSFISIFLITILIVDPITPNKYGGGVFLKLSIIFDSNYLMYFASYLGFLVLLINLNKNNLLIYLCFLFIFPFITIYQKYYDPLLIIVILLLSKKDFFEKIFVTYKYNIKLIFIYYGLFLIFSNFYYNQI